jgi:hypothetical protein
VMPGSPSPEGRKPGICQTGQLVTREGPEGSNPSPGAHLRETSICFKTDGCGREAKVVKVGTGRRRMNTTTTPSLNDTITTAQEEKEEQARTEEDYQSLDRLVDSITQDFSRKGINSRLKALARRSINTATICDHILAEQTEQNIKTSTAESKVKSLLWISKYLNEKPFEEMTKQDILSYLNSLRKPTSTDPQQKWIGSYNNRLRYYAKFFRWLYNREEPDYRKRISPPCIQGLRQLPRQEKSSYKPSLLSQNELDFLFGKVEFLQVIQRDLRYGINKMVKALYEIELTPRVDKGIYSCFLFKMMRLIITG